MSAWSPHYAKDMELLEKVQSRFTRMFTELKDKNYHERLRHLNLRTLEESRNRQDLIEVFKMYKEFTKLDISELIIRDLNAKRTRGHTAKLEKTNCTRDCKKYFFSHRVVGRRNSLEQETVDAPSTKASKGRLDKLRKIRTNFFMD